MKNVVLMNLSTLNVKMGKPIHYIYEGEANKRYDLDGYMTTVAPTKGIMEKLSDQGEKLDKIVMLCSETVRDMEKPVWEGGQVKDTDASWIRELVSESGDTAEKMTHQGYYEKVIRNYAVSERFSEKYTEEPISFVKIPISDMPDAQEIAEASIEAVNEVMVDGADVHLYLVFNGGQRHVALMLLNVSKLMEIRNATIEEILIMDFDNKQIITNFRGNNEPQEVVPIRTMNAVFDSVDLVSGINEYVNYGRTKMLQKYFDGCKDAEIKKILRLMESFANDMQLCRIQNVLDQREGLKTALQSYINKNKKKDTFEILFSYAAEDILQGYGKMLEGDIPEIVQWCLEKDFVQQALTFYAEKMPDYFGRKGIFAPTEKEWEEFRQFMAVGKAGKKSKIKWMANEYRKNHYGDDSGYYSWMIRYLSNTYKWVDSHPEDAKDKLWGADGFMDMSGTESFEVITKKDTGSWEAKKQYAGTFLKHLYSGRAQTNLSEQQIKKIMTGYLLIKEQRNGTNHASNKQNVLKYEEICALLKEAAGDLQEIAGKKEE